MVKMREASNRLFSKKPKDKTPYATSIIVSPFAKHTKQNNAKKTADAICIVKIQKKLTFINKSFCIVIFNQQKFLQGYLF